MGDGESGAARVRPWWKRKRVWIPAGLLVLFVGMGLMNPAPAEEAAGPAPAVTQGATPEAPEPAQQPSPSEPPEQAEPEPAAPAEPAVPAEHQAALATAQDYVDMMHMSKAGLRDQLTSEYGEKFPEDAADYAVANVKADWKANALATAQEYRDTMNMSNSAIRDQLVSEYGEKFTTAEAEWAMARLDG